MAPMKAGRLSWPVRMHLFLMMLLAAQTASAKLSGGVSKPGGAGHALLFRDHVLIKKGMQDFPTTALTFEAWISSSDFCHAGTLLSYAKKSQATDVHQRIQDFNHFVIFDPRNLLACHDFEYMDLWPDPTNSSCHAAYRGPHQDTRSVSTASAVERDGSWHHLAVTWDAAADGLINIYMDGLLMASAVTHKTEPLVPDGAFMIGGEQDCFGGCTDPSQGFHGRLDEIRLWKVARSQADILTTMRWVAGFEGNPNLVAWWRFNEPDSDEGQFRQHLFAVDSSGKGNHLPLVSPPVSQPASIPLPGSQQVLTTSSLQFRNNFAMSKEVRNMPSDSFTVEMWVKGAAIGEEQSMPRSTTLLSYATQQLDEGGSPTGFMDDALRLERVLHDLSPPWLEPFFATSTAGSVVLHINSNEHTDAADTRAWMYFDAQWTDDTWHHVSVSWDAGSGTASLLFDGKPITPFWKSDWGVREAKSVPSGGVDPSLSPSSRRGAQGALVLGQDQDCFGGCFSPSDAFFGELAVVRIWRRVVPADEVRANMGKTRPDSTNELAALYVFDAAGLKPVDSSSTPLVVDRSGQANHLHLRSDPPLYVYSTAPLAFSDGRPVAGPTPGAGGYSLALHDKQVLILTDFHDFPSTEMTLEFWMWSVDTCRPGVPFSYAAGAYEQLDNAFLLFNYNSWGVAVMEDEGTMGDHMSGISATDGNWHHVAVTWRSSTGQVVLYDNGRPMWTVTRGEGKRLPSGGTLVIGREQDCPGGCFDSNRGAAGRTSPVTNLEYGAQDFFGVIEEMRLWRVVRSPDQIRQAMAADDGRGAGGFKSPGVDPKTPGLVAYYKFDEGQGYVVKDATGNGHDLMLTQPPTWEVTRWLSTCGNAVVEGLEECDDGDLTDGDGCSAACTVEEGWVCHGSPSICKKQGGDAPGGGGAGPVPDSRGAPSSGSGRVKRSSGWIAGVVIGSVAASVAAVVGGVYSFLHRRTLIDAGTQVAHSVGSVSSQLRSSLLGRSEDLMRLRQGSLSGMSYDPLEAAPFLAVSPAPTQRPSAPGGLGAYQSLADSPRTDAGLGQSPGRHDNSAV